MWIKLYTQDPNPDPDQKIKLWVKYGPNLEMYYSEAN